MVGVKGLNESDGEEVDQETAESEKTSNDDSESSTPSGSDDDDSSVDEEDCERRRNECIDDMADLERQFFHLREQLYNERHMQVTVKLEEVKAGIAVEYVQPLEELKDTMEVRMEVAKILKELKTKNIENKGDAENQASNQNFESEKSLLWDSIKGELEDKIRRLEEDRNSIDITSDLWNEQVNHRKNKRKADSQSLDKRKKPVAVTGPFIVYMLHENDILEDWTTIRKALKASKQSSEYEFSPSEQRYSARFADGNLIFKGESFRKGEHVIIEDKLDSSSARVISVNTSEVLLQKQDGSWLRIYICDLQSGKYSIQRAFV